GWAVEDLEPRRGSQLGAVDAQLLDHGAVRLRVAGRDRRGFQLAEDPAHIDAPGRDGEIRAGGRNADMKTARLLRHATRPDHIQACDLVEIGPDGKLLVPLGIELHPSLLHEDVVVVLLGTEGGSGEVAFHCRPPQVTKKTPAASPKRRYSLRAARRLASRWGWTSELKAPISDELSAPVRISAAQVGP